MNSPPPGTKTRPGPLLLCLPVCQVDYSVIKLDGDGDEINSWTNHLGLNLTSSHAHTKGGAQSSDKRALDYFSQLSKDQVEALYNIYRLDFLLFSYKPDSFMNVAEDDSQGLEYLENARLHQISEIDS
eukprot:TRINITY_DN21823_c0_g1_i1.p1 TRINITY_DN21823_c0_g1~~TRINITY_DN21823_c0_g1_i1.p1  ORF type:complete len:145 (-),score=30.76 TRINITY_DN21823_c0_g1_i1:70-453(-)